MAAEPFLKSMVEDIFKGGVGIRFKAEVLDRIRHRTYQPLARFDQEQGVLVANGVLDLDGNFGPFDPARYDTIQIPVSWDPEAECPVFSRCLRE